MTTQPRRLRTPSPAGVWVRQAGDRPARGSGNLTGRRIRARHPLHWGSRCRALDHPRVRRTTRTTRVSVPRYRTALVACRLLHPPPYELRASRPGGAPRLSGSNGRTPTASAPGTMPVRALIEALLALGVKGTQSRARDPCPAHRRYQAPTSTRPFEPSPTTPTLAAAPTRSTTATLRAPAQPANIAAGGPGAARLYSPNVAPPAGYREVTRPAPPAA